MGALLGWLASRILSPKGFVPMVEAMAVGVFGAFLGGEFLPAMVLVPPPGGGATPLGPVPIAMAVAVAVVCLFLLGLMRRAVGPLKSGKKRRSA